MLRKYLPYLIYLGPPAILLVYPFIFNGAGLGPAAAPDYEIKPLAQALTLMGHYLQAAVLILTILLSFKIGRAGRIVRLLAVFTAIGALLLTFYLREWPLNQTLLTVFPTVFVAFLALSRVRAALGPAPGEAGYQNLKKMRSLTQLIFLINVLIGGIYLYLTFLTKADKPMDEVVYIYLSAIFLPGLVLAIMAGAGWRNQLFNQLCALSAVFLLLFNLWSMGDIVRISTDEYYSDFAISSALVSLFVLYGFCWLVLACALVLLAVGLKAWPPPGVFSREVKNFKPFRRLALMTPPAALLLAGFLVFWLYGPPASRWPEIKPLPSGFELIGPYRMGPLLVTFPDKNFDSSHLFNWITGIIDEQQAPFSFKEGIFSSPENADEEYAKAIQYAATHLPGYHMARTLGDDQTDLSAFEAYSPVLTFLHYKAYSSLAGSLPFSQTEPDRLMMALHLRLEQGCLSIYSEPPYEQPAKGDSPPRFADEQVAAFLERVKILLEAYHWLGFNGASANGYATRYGWLDPAKIPGTGLSASAGFLFGGEEGLAENSSYYLSIYLNDAPNRQYSTGNLPAVDTLGGNLVSALLGQIRVGFDLIHYRQSRAVAGQAGLEYWQMSDSYGAGQRTFWTMEWASQKRWPSSSSPWLVLNLSASIPSGSQSDQDLGFSLWEEILRRVKIETTE